MPVPDGFMTPPQISNYLSVHYEQVRQWMISGELEVDRQGRFYYVTIDSFKSLAEKRGLTDVEIDTIIREAVESKKKSATPRKREPVVPPTNSFKLTDWGIRPMMRCSRCKGNVLRGSCLMCGHEM